MRDIVTTKTVAFYDEFSESEKIKILDNLHDLNTSYDWYDYTKEDFHTILEILGYYHIDSYFTGFSSQGDGASFEAKFTIPCQENTLQSRIKKLQEYAPNYLDKQEVDLFLNMLFENDDDAYYEEIYRRGHYYHENTMYCDNKDLQQFSRLLAGKYYKSLNDEYDYLTSRVAIEETIRCNEYEFNTQTYKIDC